MENSSLKIGHMVDALAYSALGILVLLLIFWILEKITPEDLMEEVIHKNNVALAIVFAGLTISIGIIIASAIHG
jgi:uncharacterized membrane protein YjfL (UPF0719 family)